jgi:quinol monooxygenase YgiN
VTFLTMRVKEGREDEFRMLAVELTASTHDLDEGCLEYTFHQSQNDRRDFMLCEQWRDPDALRAHLARLPAATGHGSVQELLDDFCGEGNWQGVQYEIVA